MKKENQSKIAIVSTVINFELYNQSLRTHPAGVDRYVIDGREGLYGIDSLVYMFSKFQKMDYDWIIMADEDAFFMDSEKVLGLIDFMSRKGIAVAGVRDGGEVNHRNYNPYVMNTFFLILNIKDILPLWNKKEVLNTQLNNALFNTQDISKLKYSYDIDSQYEPYYCFFYWLAQKKQNFLYLNSISPISQDDQIANIVCDHEGKELLIHTWYARAYNNNLDQTKRINKIIEPIAKKREDVDYVLWHNKMFKHRKNFKRILNKGRAILKKRSSE